MGAQENVAVVQRYFDEFLNGRKAELADELMTADHSYHDPQVPTGIGPAAMAEAVAVYQDGVDGHWNVAEIRAAEGDRVMARWTGTGTHNAEVNGIPPTGKPVSVDALHIFRMDGGKIAEQWVVWDTLGFLQQIGAIPSAG